MSSIVDEVARLRDSAFFNEATIPLLEALVTEEASSSTVYNAKANRGLLKLYQMFPARLNVDNVTLILLKVGGLGLLLSVARPRESLISLRLQSLTALPEPDFLLASYLLPESYRSSEELALLSDLERQLQIGHFGAFWSKAKEQPTRALLDRVIGVDAAVRSFIAHAIAKTYQKIELAALAAAVDVVRIVAASSGIRKLFVSLFLCAGRRCWLCNLAGLGC